MIYKKIKDSNYIWNPETTLVFNKNRKVIGRYINKMIISDSESVRIAKQNNIPIDISIEKLNNEDKSEISENTSSSLSETTSENSIRNEFDFGQKMDSSMESSFYDDHPAFQTEDIITHRQASSISTDFVDLLTEEFKNKLNLRVNDLVYKIMDLESTLKNLTDDYDQLLLENQQLKKQFGK